MVMSSPRTISAALFKAQCLKLLDRVAETGEPLVVTKRGKVVARITAVDPPGVPPSLRNSVAVRGNIVGPILDAWELDR